MMSRSLIVFLLCFFSFLGGPDGVASANSPQETLNFLKRQTASINSITSEFQQETRIPLFKNPVFSEGRFLFKRPDALLWEITQPAREGFAMRGGNGIRWLNDRANATPFSASADPVAALVARQLITWITLDIDTIGKEYSIAVISHSPPILRLEPKRDDMRAIVLALHITFSPTGVAEKVILEETAGGTTTIRFTKTTINDTLPDSAFF